MGRRARPAALDHVRDHLRGGCRARLGRRPSLHDFPGSTAGYLEVPFAAFSKTPPFDRFDARREIQSRLNDIPNARIGDDRLEKYPGVDVTAVADPTAFETFHLDHWLGPSRGTRPAAVTFWIRPPSGAWTSLGGARRSAAGQVAQGRNFCRYRHRSTLIHSHPRLPRVAESAHRPRDRDDPRSPPSFFTRERSLVQAQPCPSPSKRSSGVEGEILTGRTRVRYGDAHGRGRDRLESSSARCS